ncbi:hypothetical protein CPB83DRAFT_481419 [Crepidotus variabilis]|uniref:Uncharacterized protein n=1 Tax=Crepidotus variabilis TaxID=179855 RepID=A0A9P6EQL2_9AGAR|nr:hypothetical protein CPB83DRAFT_481419 [Crepidotus variabilis]
MNNPHNLLSSAPQANPTFPQEIFDQIVDALGDIESQNFIEEIRDDGISESEVLVSYQDTSGLLACSLVSRSFSDRARQHLFQRVEMITLDSERDVDAWLETFHELLGWRPRRIPDGDQLCGIRPYIKEFAASDTNGSEASMEVVTQDFLAEVLWALNDGVYGLEELDLGIELKWATLTHGLQHAIMALIQSKQLKILKLYGFIDLPSTIFLNSAFKHLRAIECFTNLALNSAVDPALLDSIHTYPALESLETDFSLTATHFASCTDNGRPDAVPSSSPLKGLRRLSIWLIDDRVFRSEDAALLLSSAAHTLQRLELRYYPVPRVGLPIFQPPLHSFSQLRCLQLYHCEGVSRKGPLVFPQPFITLLLSESTIFPQSLERLEIFLAHPYIYSDMEDIITPFDNIGEAEIIKMVDRKLSYLLLQSNVQALTLRIRLHPSVLTYVVGDVDGFVTDGCTKLKALFSATSEENILCLNIEFSEDFDYYYSRNLEVFVPEEHPMADL